MVSTIPHPPRGWAPFLSRKERRFTFHLPRLWDAYLFTRGHSASLPQSLWNCTIIQLEAHQSCFPFASFRILIVYKETFHFSPRNLRIEDFADPSRRLADLWALAHTDSKMAMPFLPTANNVCGLYPFSPERGIFRKLSFAHLQVDTVYGIWWAELIRPPA